MSGQLEKLARIKSMNTTLLKYKNVAVANELLLMIRIGTLFVNLSGSWLKEFFLTEITPIIIYLKT